MLVERVAANILRYSMFGPGDRVGVAVSGGADSVCLLHVLRDLAPRWSLALRVVHIDHQLRGEESRRDARFVQHLAAELGLPFHHERVHLAAGENLEQAGRRARLHIFQQLRATGTTDKIALGHTRSDQAETVLFRFLRGAGTAGLAGIRPVTTAGVVRPLLCLTRAEVRAWLAEEGIPWQEDSSNRDDRFARNRLRNHLLPQLEREWNPAMEENLAHTADWAMAEEEYWAEHIRSLASSIGVGREGERFFQVSQLLRSPRAVRRRLVRHAIEAGRGDLRGIDFAHVEAVLRLCESQEGDGRVQLPGMEAVRSFEWLRLAPAGSSKGTEGFSVRLAVPGETVIAGARVALHLTFQSGLEMVESDYNKTGSGAVDMRALQGPLVARNWEPGDRYRPVGLGKIEKLKDLFQSARVPSWDRPQWPMVTCGDEIIWSKRFGVAAAYAAHPGSPQILSIDWKSLESDTEWEQC